MLPMSQDCKDRQGTLCEVSHSTTSLSKPLLSFSNWWRAAPKIGPYYWRSGMAQSAWDYSVPNLISDRSNVLQLGHSHPKELHQSFPSLTDFEYKKLLWGNELFDMVIVDNHLFLSVGPKATPMILLYQGCQWGLRHEELLWSSHTVQVRLAPIRENRVHRGLFSHFPTALQRVLYGCLHAFLPFCRIPRGLSLPLTLIACI